MTTETNPLLWLTVERLREWGACAPGDETFRQKFPNGTDARTCMLESVRAGNWGNLRYMRKTLTRVLSGVPGGAEALAEALEGIPEGPPTSRIPKGD